MSRRYNEQWLRRKSALVRSLFYDVPLLSPVPEESLESDINHSHDPSEGQNRPCSPLPPLIIEREPNRHDEPEEYYVELLKKMKKLYRKLFIENQGLDSEDFNVTNSFHEGNNDESDLEMSVRDGHDNVSIESHITVHSEDYVADFESSNESIVESFVEKSNNLIDEEESDGEQIDKVNLVVDTEIIESNSQSNNVSTDKETLEPKSKSTSNKTSENSNFKSLNGNADSNIYNQDMDLTEVNKTNEEFYEEKSTSSFGIFQDMGDEVNVVYRGIDSIVEEHRISIEREVIAPNDETKGGDETDGSFDAGSDYRQITTVALVHVDGSQQNVGRISPVYETVTSPIIPADVVIQEKRTAILEEQDDPEQTSSLSDDHNANVEEMRTPRREESIESNPISRYSSNINEQSPNIELPTAQEIENRNPSLEPNISKDILSIINDSNKDKSVKSSGRKRKIFEDISTQTVRQVSWNEMKNNFFVGTPKIFRLCQCVDHDCTEHSL